MQENTLGFGVLGPLLMSVGGTPVALGAAKLRAVLAMLVINRNRPVGMDSLIYAVWDESPVPAARESIQSYVSNLRRLLASAGIEPQRVLATVPPGYRLSIADADCDLGRFNSEKMAGVEAAVAGRFEQARNHLSAALAQWRGPVLADLRDFPFAEAFATAVTEDKVSAQTACAEAEIACGRAAGVIGDLEALTAEYPYREPVWAQLITAYYVAQRQSDAIDAYRRLKTTLAEDLGIDPGPTVSALYGQVLRQEPLDTKRAAQSTAKRTLGNLKPISSVGGRSVIARLRDTAGHHYALHATTTLIGRDSDNDIVLDDAYVSRHHAVIIDTGASFVITDLRSANGIEVQRQRVRTSANLTNGDHIRIGDHEFTFEIQLH